MTVLSLDAPIRVFQRFATVDAASNGCAEVILGRSSSTKSFPLFGLCGIAKQSKRDAGNDISGTIGLG